MKTSLFAAAFCALTLPSTLFAGGEGWSSDFEASKKAAADGKKDLLMDFTGSDWCGWCIKLNKEVFSKDEFKTGVKDKFVLVELDFPQDDSKLSEATKAQNKELGEKFAIQGYPSIVLADSAGRPYAYTGYQAGGAESYVKHLDELREKKTKRDQAFAEADKLEGPAKAKALVSALKEMELEPPVVSAFYGDVVEKIKTSDPKDETGFTKEAAAADRLRKFEEQLQEFAQKKDHKGALALVEATIKEGGFEKSKAQEMILTKASIQASSGDFDAALKTVDEARAFHPESPINGQLDGFKKQLEKARDKKKSGAKEDKEEAGEEEEAEDK